MLPHLAWPRPHRTPQRQNCLPKKALGGGGQHYQRVEWPTCLIPFHVIASHLSSNCSAKNCLPKKAGGGGGDIFKLDPDEAHAKKQKEDMKPAGFGSQKESKTARVGCWGGSVGAVGGWVCGGALCFGPVLRLVPGNRRRARGPPEPRSPQAVCELQRRLPNARLLYVSATGATEAENLWYMERLGG